MVESLVRLKTFSSSLKTLQLLEVSSGKGGSTVATAIRGSVFKLRILSGGARSYLVRALGFWSIGTEALWRLGEQPVLCGSRKNMHQAQPNHQRQRRLSRS